ncbi:hypothetical protein Acsp02_34070 [Actinoplanes sp. NBRC 103695]|nr:hypothetical protein Acsp02_34070 [Actinoplanes sp. NBRC 103695]
MRFCANVVCGPEGDAAAVLLRAGAVIDGLETARQRRPAARGDHDLARGPAKLMQVPGLDKSAYGTSLIDGTGSALLTPPPVGSASEVEAGPRVGATSAHDVTWRFWAKGDPTVSAYRRAGTRSRRAAAS